MRGKVKQRVKNGKKEMNLEIPFATEVQKFRNQLERLLEVRASNDFFGH
jgi:hypothetical protein